MSMNGTFRQSMTWLHTWSGIVVVWLLYFMFVTGTLGYFDDEIDLWMKPEVGPSEQAPLNVTVPRLQAWLEKEKSDADLWFLYPTVKRTNPHPGVFYQLPAISDDDEVRGRQDFNLTAGRPLDEVRETGGGQVLYRMHYLLHYLPGLSGYYVMAVVTMFMFVGLMTGVVAHKKIFKDFFTLRWAKGQRTWLDLHNVASVATLPFQFMITYSGLLFTLSLLWMPLVVVGGYGFEVDRIKQVVESIQGESIDRANIPANQFPLVDLANQAELAWGKDRIAYIRVDYPGDANSRVTIGREGFGRANRDSITFDGVSGVPIDDESRGSLDNNAAFAVANVMLSFHEGTFANYVLRWLYFLSGLLGTVMIGTGAIYWVEKRRPKSSDNPGTESFRAVERANVATIAGLIAAVGLYFMANRLLPVDFPQRADWEVHCMFLAWLALFVHSALRPPLVAWREQCSIIAIIFLALPVVNELTTDVGLLQTLDAGNWRLAGFDITAIVTGLAAAVIAYRINVLREPTERKAASNQIQQPLLTPADS